MIEDECIWKRPDAQAPVIDRRKITISSPSEDLYQLDFDIEMEMLMDVTIQKTNHSLFSARIDPDLTVRQGGVMINSEGKEGEKGTFGVGSSWSIATAKEKPERKGLQSCSILPINGIRHLGSRVIMALYHRPPCTGRRTEKRQS